MVEGAAETVCCGVEFVDDGDVEALAEGFPDVGAHAVAPGHVELVGCVEGVGAGRGVDEVAAEFADVLEDVGLGGVDLGPKGAVGEFAGEDDGCAGVDGGGYAKAVGGAVVQGEAGVHSVWAFVAAGFGALAEGEVE